MKTVTLAEFFQALGDGVARIWSTDPLISTAFFFGAFGLVMLTVYAVGKLCTAAGFFKPRTPNADSRIGYKRAWLEGDSFKGVVGIPYDVDEEANGPGFHAYSTFRDARYHPQAGNVYLEVLLSGYIQEHDLGYTASHQRVLQVIAGDCSESDCKLPATHYFLDPRPTVEPAPLFLCQRHSRLPSRIKARRSVQRLSNQLRGDSFDRPVEELAEDFEWLKEAGVVVAPYSGKEAFIPTVISPKE